ncbi:MAG TPA: GTPase Era [Clostridiales bacterium]|nr:GTPase Era [Clostridiales bacterium]
MIDQKSAFITIIGRPNVGKSSLLNKILNRKVSIVSDKPQTTRTRIMGVLTQNNDQLVFIDTPGFHKPKTKLGQSMVKAVSSGMTDVHGVMMVVEAVTKFRFDPDNLPTAELELIKEIKNRKLNAILAINKIDLLKKKEDLLEIISAYNKVHDFQAIVPVSAVTGEGIQPLLSELFKFCVPEHHYFPDDVYTDQPDRVMVAEIIREKLLHLLDKEVPHGIAVDLERFVERDTSKGEPILDIEAVIYCEKRSHKGIIIGKNGSMLKQVGIQSREEIEFFFGCKVALNLWVKVKEDWRNRPGLIHSFGLD